MGMFDSFLVRLKCPTCKMTDLREIQTKEFANILASYHIGDIIEDAPIGEFWLKDTWLCKSCYQKKLDKQKYEHPIYIRLMDGLFINTYSDSEYEVQKRKAMDTYEIMQLFRKSAYKGTNRKALIQRIYGLIKGAKADWRNAGGEKENFPLALPKNNDELVDEIMQMIEHYKKQEPELDENPPWL